MKTQNLHLLAPMEKTKVEYILESKMRRSYIICTIFYFISIGTYAQKSNLEHVLEGLSKSYVLNYDRGSLEPFLACYSVKSKESFFEDNEEYGQAVVDFYNIEPDGLADLMKMKNDTLHINKWIVTEPFCKSSLVFNDLVTNHKGAYVLLMNYLSFDGVYVINKKFLSEVSDKKYDLVLRFLDENKGLNSLQLRKKWSFESRE